MKALMILTIALALAAGALFTPAVVHADLAINNLARAVAYKVCNSGDAYNNGCKAYMAYRLQKGKSPSEALSSAESACDDWYPGKPNGLASCKQGAQYLRGME